MRPKTVFMWWIVATTACASTAWARDKGPAADTASEATRFVSPTALEHFIRGRLFFELAQYEESVAEFRRALASDRNSAYLHWQLAEALRRVGRVVSALTEFEQALDLDPHLKVALESLASLHHSTGRDRAAQK